MSVEVQDDFSTLAVEFVDRVHQRNTQANEFVCRRLHEALLWTDQENPLNATLEP